MRYTYSDHAETVALERGIAAELVLTCLDVPDRVERPVDGTTQYIRCFPELEGRWLRVVTNEMKNPPVIVTLFFDRRLRRKP